MRTAGEPYGSTLGPIIHIGYHKAASSWFQAEFFPRARNAHVIPRSVVAREILLPLMLLPLLVPLLIAVVQITGALLAGDVWTGVWLRVLVAFDVIFVVTSWLTFGFVLQE